MEPDIEAYNAVMEEIKRRTAVVTALVNNTATVMYKSDSGRIHGFAGADDYGIDRPRISRR
jgi:hypothetical protein